MTAVEVQARSIFLAAMERAPGEWPAFLDVACSGNADLRANVEQLLRAHEAMGSIHGGGGQRPVITIDQQPPERPGTQIGPYKLLQQIGEGGMGVVYMAEQTEPVQRKVALKVIKPGMDSRQVIARFEAERQALAMMDHVNIARVLDAGATESGRPYFVMELVHGVPITKYCDDNRLTPRQRLELFVPVCQAIQHAHQKGIIHRDIKPSNVMVTLYDGKPVPKVIDFGVAKATEQKLTERTLFTQYGTMVGTLEYMSPEQAEMSALGVDTRSDIYSLGVLLYELLTGSTPLSTKRMKEAAYAEILRLIKEEEPPKPSTRLSESGEALASISAQRHTEPAKLSKLMRGELDWIVMKTLEKDRNRRYETASGFAADVQRYLNDEPVQACPPSAGYRLRKFGRRNKRTLVTAALLGVMLLAALGAITGTVGWAVRDREVLEQELARKEGRDLVLTEQGIGYAVEQATKIRGELHVVLTKPGGVQELLNQPGRWRFSIQSAQSELAQARRLMARADGSLSAELTQSLHNLEEQLSGDEADRLLALRLEEIRLGRATMVEGRFEIRRAAAEYPQAFAGFAVLKEDVATAAATLRSSPINEQLVAALDDWAHVAFGLRNEPLAEKLMAVARQVAPDPAWGDRLRQLKHWRDQEALGKLVEEAPVARLSPQMLVLVGVLLPEQSSIQESWIRRAQGQYPADFWLNYLLGNSLLKTHPVEASGFYRVALAVRPTSSAAYNNLGNALRNQKKLPEAIAAYHKAIEFDPKYAYAYSGLGNALLDQKKPDEAIDACRKAIELDPMFAGPHIGLGNAFLEQKKLDEAIVAYRKAIEIAPELAGAYLNLGKALKAQGKLDEAIVACRKAIDLDPKLAEAHVGLGNTLFHRRKLDEAIAAYHKAIEIDPKHAKAYINLGAALYHQKKSPEAIAACRKAIELDPTQVEAHGNLGAILDSLRDYENAAVCFRKVIELDPKSALAHNCLGNALYGQKKLPEAIACFRKAIQLDPKSAVAYNCLGNALHGQKKLPEAITCFRKAIEIDATYAMAYRNLGNALRDQKMSPEAIAACRKAIELDPKNVLAHNDLAWWLSTCLEPELRDPAQAVTLARKVVELAPQEGTYWNTLGVSLYRSSDWKEAIAALEKSRELRKGGDSVDSFFLAMAHWQLNQKDEARAWYEKAVEWMEKNQPNNEELHRFRSEAAELIGIMPEA